MQTGITYNNVRDRIGKTYYQNGGGVSRSTIQIRALQNIDSLIEIGATLSYEQYDFTVGTRTPATNPTNGIDLDYSGNYIFLKPIVGIGIGPKRIFHFYVVPSLGVLTNGYESMRWYDKNKPADKYTYAHSNGMNRLLFRIGLEAEQQLPLSGSWRVLINEGYQFAISKITSSEVLRNDARTASPRAAMLSLRIGVSYSLNKPLLKKLTRNSLAEVSE